ncbi:MULTISPECIES: alpha/beta fold hydrolase [Paenibacillus]|uniref:alpha/beta fold hydrolase n=1 Tax=Paenibacillus TaxID=44249 RepID=UPI00046E6EAC|nr:MULTISPECIES: alpha/beta fold hydrolase [Paenibacillus]OMF39770.1 hypothetical protein BK135_25035 [Paenibacillus peoriae]
MTKVLFIPGIKGSQLFEGNHKRWYPSNPKDIEALHIDNKLKEGDALGRVTIPSMLQDINIYEGIINHFGGPDFGVFTYDWRQSVFSHLHKLDDRLEEMGEKTTIIAHSMGGMLTKAYLSKYGDAKVDKIITIGTPWLGSPDAFKAILFGEPMISENDLTYHFMNYSRDNIAKKLARSFPSTFELLPSKNYYDSNGGEFFRNSVGKKSSWDQIVSKLHIDDEGSESKFKKYALPMHEIMLEEITVPNYALIGYGMATLKSIPERTKSRFDKTIAHFWNGDSVVPLISSHPPHRSENFYVHGEHKVLCSLPETIEWIEWVLQGLQGDIPSKITTEMPSVKLKKVIMARILCPVGYTLRDNNGNSISGDLDPESIDLSNISNKRELYVQHIGDAKYVFLNEQDVKQNNGYNLEVDSYDKGLANLSVVNYSDVAEDEIANFKSVPIDEGTVLKLRIGENAKETDLEVFRGKGKENVKKTIVRKDIFNEEFNEDVADKPFKIIVTPAGEVKKRGRITKVFSGEVNLKVEFDKEQVSEIFWTLNNGSAKEYINEIVITPENGPNSLTVYARDFVGNSFEAENYNFTVENDPAKSVLMLEFDPEYGLGVSLKTKANSVGIKFSQFRILKSSGKYTKWRKTHPSSFDYFSIENIFGVGNGTTRIEYQSVDNFDRDEPMRSIEFSIGNLRELIWGENISSVTPLSLWKNIFPETKIGTDKVIVLLKNKTEIGVGDEIPDNSREIVYVNEDIELKIRFMEQYTLYWSGPPTEVIKKGNAYEFSFQLLTDHKLAITETNPVVRYYQLNQQGKIVGGGITVNIELKKDEFFGSFTVSNEYNGNKVRLRVTDNKHKNPPLREATLMIED